MENTVLCKQQLEWLVKDLNEIQCFIKTVELKSFTAAAKALDLPKSSVSRKIRDLENRLGATLIIRTTRNLQVTEIGSIYYDRVSPAFHKIEMAEDELHVSRGRVDGTIRITAPLILSNSPLNSLISTFIQKYHNIKIELILCDEIMDLVRDKFDFGLRIGNLKNSSLKVKKLFSFDAPIVAHPEFFKDNLPVDINDLDKDDFIGFCPQQQIRSYVFKNGGKTKTIKPNGRVLTNDLLSMKDLIVSGTGIGPIPTYLIANELEQNQLITVCSDWIVKNEPLYIVFPEQKFITPKMRAFLDHADSFLQKP